MSWLSLLIRCAAAVVLLAVAWRLPIEHAWASVLSTSLILTAGGLLAVPIKDWWQRRHKVT
jgi:hypothetical protein